MRISDWSSDVCSSDLSRMAAIAPVASGTSASVLKAAAPCQRAKRRPEDGVLVDSVMGVLRACGKRSLYADRNSVVQGKSVSVRGDLGGRRINQHKNN